MRAADKIGKGAIRLANELINIAVLTGILLLLAFGCYAVWDSGQIYHAADAARYESYKPGDGGGGASFDELRAINPEVLAWLTVYGTHIGYPVAQGGDNMKYVDTDAKGKYSLSGAIFLDCRNNPDFSDFSSILYGHHMDKQAMFGEIGLFAEQSYFDAREFGTLYYGGQEHGLTFVAFVHADAYDDSVFRTQITDRDERQAYLDSLIRRAEQTRDVPVTADDRLLLLSTCSASSTNGRDILIGKFTDEIHRNPFETEKPDKMGIISAVDKLSGIGAQIPLGVSKLSCNW